MAMGEEVVEGEKREEGLTPTRPTQMSWQEVQRIHKLTDVGWRYRQRVRVRERCVYTNDADQQQEWIKRFPSTQTVRQIDWRKVTYAGVERSRRQDSLR